VSFAEIISSMGSNSEVNDTEIVDRVIGADLDAYAEIIDKYENKLQRYVSYLIGDTTLAKDVVQETFIKAYQNLQGFNRAFKFSSWIYRIAHNEAMNAVKKNRDQLSEDIELNKELSYVSNIEERIDSELLKKDVEGCLILLEPKYRSVVQLVYFENMKYDEVADVLRVPRSTVGVWLTRAKKQLKSICEKKGVSK
jgi:RNA polymerase sigma-70 factor, ECF subfamily